MILNIQRQPGANIIAVVDRVTQAAAATSRVAARVRRRRDFDRPHHHDPRFGAGC